MSSKINHCQTCGYQEPSLDLLVCCSACREVMVHRYCMNGPLRYGDEEVVWSCDNCSPKTAKPLKVERCVENSFKVPKVESKMFDTTSVEVKQESAANTGPRLQCERGLVDSPHHGFDTMTNQHDEKNITLDTKLKSIFVPSCGSLVREDDVKCLVDNPRYILPSLERPPSLPQDDISWRGTCRITHEMYYKESFELKAHLSITASSNVAKAVQTLPMPLNLELVHKSNNWPKRFKELPPTGEDIGLYFFPMQESDVKHCAAFIEKMLDDDLVLSFSRNDLKLLLFTSFDLPKEIMSFKGKCYLWGVFSSPTKPSFTDVNPSHPHIVKDASQNINFANFGKSIHEKENQNQSSMPSPSGIQLCKPCSTISSESSKELDGHKQVIGSQPTYIVYALPVFSPFNKKRKRGHSAGKEKTIQRSNGKTFSDKDLKSEVHGQVQKKKKRFSHEMHPMKRSAKSHRLVESNMHPGLNTSLHSLPKKGRFAKPKNGNQMCKEKSSSNP